MYLRFSLYLEILGIITYKNKTDLELLELKKKYIDEKLNRIFQNISIMIIFSILRNVSFFFALVSADLPKDWNDNQTGRSKIYREYDVHFYLIYNYFEIYL